MYALHVAVLCLVVGNRTGHEFGSELTRRATVCRTVCVTRLYIHLFTYYENVSHH